MEKKFKDYNAKDLHEQFQKLYKEIHDESYDYNNGKNKSPFPFIGDEIKALKKLKDSEDIFDILCAMFNAIGQNTTYFSVLNFISSYERYKTKNDPKLYWHIIISNNKKIKDAWFRLNILKATWFTSAEKNKEVKLLESKFEKWLENIEKVA